MYSLRLGTPFGSVLRLTESSVMENSELWAMNGSVTSKNSLSIDPASSYPLHVERLPRTVLAVPTTEFMVDPLASMQAFPFLTSWVKPSVFALDLTNSSMNTVLMV